MTGRPGITEINIKQLRRLVPVVIRGRTVWLIVAELFYLFFVLLVSLMEGTPTSAILKSTIIIPAMLLIALCTADTIPTLRRNGELELVVTLANPMRMLLHRMLPAIVMVGVQIVGVSLFLAFIRNPLHCLIGLFASPIPLAMAVACSLYWNLRCRGTGAVVFATMLTLLPAVIWIGSAHLLYEPFARMNVTRSDVIVSCLMCQAGILMAACFLAARAARRLDQPEKVLGD